MQPTVQQAAENHECMRNRGRAALQRRVSDLESVRALAPEAAKEELQRRPSDERSQI
jgi:hypothetical protein